MDAKLFGKNVLISRRDGNLSQEQLAKIAGVSRNYISMIERGEAENVSIEIIRKLAEGLGVKIEVLTNEPSKTNYLVIPSALREFAIKEGLSYEIVDKLRQMVFRGLNPKTAKDWKELYQALKPFLERNK